MVRYEDEKVIIEIDDPAPKEFIASLKIALTAGWRNSDIALLVARAQLTK